LNLPSVHALDAEKLSSMIKRTFAPAGTYSHPFTSMKNPIPLGDRVVHLGFEYLEEAGFANLLTCFRPLDQGTGSMA